MWWSMLYDFWISMFDAYLTQLWRFVYYLFIFSIYLFIFSISYWLFILLDAVVVELVVAPQGRQGASADGVGKEDLRGWVDPTFGRVKFWPENIFQVIIWFVQLRKMSQTMTSHVYTVQKYSPIWSDVEEKPLTCPFKCDRPLVDVGIKENFIPDQLVQ